MDNETTPARPPEYGEATGSAPFDLEAVYDAEVSPLMAQIIATCKRVGMPMLTTFCYAKGREADDPEEVMYCTTVLPRGGWQTPEITEALRPIRNGASCRPRMMAMMIMQPNDTLQGSPEVQRKEIP